jgi:hypothetical protein
MVDMTRPKTDFTLCDDLAHEGSRTIQSDQSWWKHVIFPGVDVGGGTKNVCQACWQRCADIRTSEERGLWMLMTPTPLQFLVSENVPTEMSEAMRSRFHRQPTITTRSGTQ